MLNLDILSDSLISEYHPHQTLSHIWGAANGHGIKAALASIDVKIAALTPLSAPLVLADPVQTTTSIVVPPDELDGMTTNDVAGGRLVDAA